MFLRFGNERKYSVTKCFLTVFCAIFLLAGSLLSPSIGLKPLAEQDYPQKMLHVITTGSGTFSQYTKKLDANTEYTVRFQISFKTGSTDSVKMKLGMGNYWNKSLPTEPFSIDTSSGINTGVFKFTTAESGGYDIGFNTSEAVEYYIAGLIVYRSDDEEKTNVLQMSVDNDGLSAFRAAKGASFSDTKTTINKITLSVENYNLVCFETETDKMLHVKNTSGNITFSQWTGKLTAGTEYTVSFRYHFVSGQLGENVFAVIGKGNFWNGTVLEVNSFTDSSDKYTIASFNFTASENSGYDIGFKINGVAEFYIFGMTVYQSSDTQKHELFERTLNNNGLSCFRKAKGAAFSNEQPKIDNCTLAVENYNDALFKIPSKKMIRYFNQNQQAGIYTPVTVKANKTYRVSFKYKLAQGAFATDKGAGITVRVYNGGLNGVVATTYSNGSFAVSDESGWYVYTATLTPNADNSGYLAIIANNGDKSKTELYIADLTMYDTEDEKQTGLLNISSRDSDLSGWRLKTVATLSGTEYSDENQSISLMEYDDSYFRVSTEKTIRLYNTGVMDGICTPVTVSAGKTYKVTFVYKLAQGAFAANNGAGITVRVYNGGLNGVVATTYLNGSFTVSDDSGWNVYTATLTPTEDNIGYLGIIANNGDKSKTELYIAGLTMYNEADETKTNILQVSGKTNDLNGWKLKSGTELSGTTFSNTNTTVELLEYDETYFKLDTSHKMLHIDDYGGDAFFGQNVTLKKGVSYTIAFQYRFLKGDIGSGVHVAVQPRLGSGRYAAYHSTQLNDVRAFAAEQVRDDYVTYTFTLQDRNYSGGSYTVKDEDTYGIGFHFSGKVELYLADFVLYETNDTEKKNLLPVKNYGNGLLGWRSDWSVAAGDSVTFTDNGKKYTVDLLPYQTSTFEEPPEVVGSHKMIYFQNFSDYHVVCQRIKLKAGSTYRFAVSLSSTVQARAMLQHNGARNNVYGNLKPIEDPVVTGDYFTEIFEFTVPEYVGTTKVNTSEMYLGIQFPAATSAYIFDAKLWDVSDPTEKNIFKNTNFDKGLDEWVVTWGAWFIDGRQGLGLKSFELDGSFKIEVMDFDEEKFIPYDSDERFNDGIWWKQSDVAQVDKTGVGSVTGTLRNEKGEPVSGVRLYLKSQNKSYNTTTDANGYFLFKNIPNDFYELYVVDSNGEEHFADFAYTIEIGSVITVSLNLDSTYAMSAHVDLTRGFINGTLYTADKVPVPNKRIYIRNLGAVLTDEDGYFSFPALEAGEYELYTYDEYGKEYALKKVTVIESTETTLKLKYAPVVSDGGIETIYVIYIIFAAVGILCIGFLLAGVIILKRERRNAI